MYIGSKAPTEKRCYKRTDSPVHSFRCFDNWNVLCSSEPHQLLSLLCRTILNWFVGVWSINNTQCQCFGGTSTLLKICKTYDTWDSFMFFVNENVNYLHCTCFMRCTNLQDFLANSRILVSQCGGPGSAGVPFFLPSLRQDCHSIFASPKISLSQKPKKYPV